MSNQKCPTCGSKMWQSGVGPACLECGEVYDQLERAGFDARRFEEWLLKVIAISISNASKPHGCKKCGSCTHNSDRVCGECRSKQ
jgi:hypothetical protein